MLPALRLCLYGRRGAHVPESSCGTRCRCCARTFWGVRCKAAPRSGCGARDAACRWPGRLCWPPGQVRSAAVQLVAITLHLSRSVLLEPELLMRPRAPGAMQPTLFFSSAGRHQPVSCLVGGASHLVSFYEQLKQPRLAVQPGHPVCRRKGSLCRARLAGTRRLLSWHSS